MADAIINLSGLPSENPATPADGWSYSIGSQNGRITNGEGFFPLSGGRTGWTSDVKSVPDGSGDLVVTATLYVGADASSNSSFVTLLNSDGNGYAVKKEPYSLKTYSVNSGSINGSLTELASAGSSPTATGHVLAIKYNPSTGSLRSFYNGSVVSTATNTTYSADDLYGGFAVDGYYGFIGISSATAFNVAGGVSVASVNGGSPITVGQTAIPAIVSGFGGDITSITTGESGLTATVLLADGDDVEFEISGWVDEQQYPLVPDTITFTFSDGTDSADIGVVVNPDSQYSQVTFSSPDTSDPKKFGKMFSDAGLTVDGSTLHYKTDTIPDLVINPDSSGDPVANGGTFEAWLREVDTGLMRAWTITINEQGVPTDMYRGLIAKGLAATGFTAKYLTAVGL